ncbi:MAG TPA: hypothetical protein DIS66_00590 [Candidatus Omnitrophica bacterium]|nr:hypothetical protein [Candidatus Omnitrophota bacterium]
MYTIQIVGAGYTGARIARFFKEKKQKVFALTRSAEKAGAFQAEGIEPIIADLTRPETLSKIPPAHFIVICPAPDPVSSAATEKSYEDIYLKGIGNYLEAIRKNPKPFLIVYLSSTGVWQDQSGDKFDESVAPQPISEKAKILVRAEQQILSSGFSSAVLRLSGIYGPGRNRLRAFREGSWPSAQDRWMNVIHVDDIAAALPIFFKNAKEGQVYLGTDDEPFRVSDLTRWLAQKTGVSKEFSFECQAGGRRLSNQKLKSLGIELKYPSFREGYSQILEEESK